MSDTPSTTARGIVVGQPFFKPVSAPDTTALALNPYGLHGVEEGNEAKRHPTPIRGFLIAARVLAGVIAVTAVGGIVFAAVVIALRTQDYTEQPEEGRFFTKTLAEVFYSLSIAESVLCLATALTCFALLFTQQHRVVTRNPRNGPFGCLRASFILFLCAIYSCCITALFGDFSSPVTCSFAAVPAIRAASLISFFGVLVANSQREPFDC